MESIQPWAKMREFLPPLSSYERKELTDSLSEYGLQKPILVWKNKGLIIDGNTRWKLLNGKIPEGKIDYFEGTEEQAFNLGVQLNFARRQLSNEQKKELCQKLRKQGIPLEKVSDITSIPKSTISDWEQTKIITNSDFGKSNNPYDLRISIPKKEYNHIHERYKAGESQQKIATDLKVGLFTNTDNF